MIAFIMNIYSFKQLLKMRMLMIVLNAEILSKEMNKTFF